MLVAVNGVEVEHVDGEDRLPEGDPAFEVVPGASYALDFDLHDPNGDAIAVWFPRAPGGLDFAADATQGVWQVPDPLIGLSPLEVILEDDAEPARASQWFIPLWVAE